MRITVIGGGLAGCEAAWQLANRDIHVDLIEMKPNGFSPAHSSENLAELVCSNSLRSNAINSGPGLLKAELRLLNSLIMEAADSHAVPAGKALAVDRELFSAHITQAISNHPLIKVHRTEVKDLSLDSLEPMIVATGPLTSDPLAASIQKLFGATGLSFYDAIAPIISADSINMDKMFRASRYDEGETEGDYLNAPMNKEEYTAFVHKITAAQIVDPHPFEVIPHFEGCLPVEVLAKRGLQTLAFGPMKPVGLVNPKTGEKPYAVVQLRAENQERSLYNLVGFQTKMTYPEQQRVFTKIPGLEQAQFVRFGSVHRNTYIDSPTNLDEYSRAKTAGNIYFAGQITGVEGYIESTASGLIIGIYAAHLVNAKLPSIPPDTTAIGALMKHTRTKPVKKFEPMNINFGLLAPPPPGTNKKSKKDVLARRALEDIQRWISALEM